jgi:glycine/D-amino acid oxidase-like deaminating enzyme
VTVMCGPFFSCMPFPPRGVHTLSHVRYTPRATWFTGTEEGPGEPEPPPVQTDGYTSAFAHMRRDAARYVPALNDAAYRGSLFEVKTLLPRNEVDDGRPILFKRDHGLAGHHVIMGGKIDNVYDMETEIGRMFA